MKITPMNRFLIAKERGYTGSLREFQKSLKETGGLVMKERKAPSRKRKPRELERRITSVLERIHADAE